MIRALYRLKCETQVYGEGGPREVPILLHFFNTELVSSDVLGKDNTTGFGLGMFSITVYVKISSSAKATSLESRSAASSKGSPKYLQPRSWDVCLF